MLILMLHMNRRGWFQCILIALVLPSIMLSIMYFDKHLGVEKLKGEIRMWVSPAYIDALEPTQEGLTATCINSNNVKMLELADCGDDFPQLTKWRMTDEYSEELNAYKKLALKPNLTEEDQIELLMLMLGLFDWEQTLTSADTQTISDAMEQIFDMTLNWKVVAMVFGWYIFSCWRLARKAMHHPKKLASYLIFNEDRMSTSYRFAERCGRVPKDVWRDIDEHEGRLCYLLSHSYEPAKYMVGKSIPIIVSLIFFLFIA